MKSSLATLSIFAAVFTAQCIAACPNIKPWSGRQSRDEVSASRPSSSVIIRGGRGHTCSNAGNCPGAVREVQETDMTDTSVPNIDCTFVVGGDGYVYDGRGWDIASSKYPESLVFCVIAKRDAGDIVTDYQKTAITDLISCAQTEGKLSSSYNVQIPRDREANSDDPPQALYKWVQGLDNYAAGSDNLIGK